jgi:hypothetical protein
MKFALLLAMIVVFIYVRPVAAQDCATIPECAANIAGARARQAEFLRATAAVVATERAAMREATAEARARLATEAALSATATEAARPTSTPRPTVTALPTVTSLPIATTQPVATVQPSATIQLVTAQPQPAALPVEVKPVDWRSLLAMAFAGTVLIGGAIYILKRL